MPAPATSNGEHKVSAGHVSMMNDVLIYNHELKVILRRMLGASHDVAALFTSTVREVLSSQPIPSDPSDTATTSPPYEELRTLMRRGKVYLASHQLALAFTILAKFPRVLQTVAPDQLKDELRKIMVEVGSDMIQAAQALKESGDTSSQSDTALRAAVEALVAGKRAWDAGNQGSSSAVYPLNRAIRQLIDAGTFVFPKSNYGQYQPPKESLAKLQSNGTVTKRSRVETFKLGDIEVPTIWWGLWQMSSASWGSGSEEAVLEGMKDMVDNGLYVADMAGEQLGRNGLMEDHYGDAELMFGEFRSRYDGPGPRPFCTTKWCQFKRVPDSETIDREWVIAKVQERVNRVGGTVDMLSIHWQHLDDERYLDVYVHLMELTKSRPDLVRYIGLINVSTKTLVKICEHLLKVTGQVGIVCNQIQYSLIDQRPRFALEAACEKYGVKLTTYGTFCGGLLSEKWLGQPAPNLYGDNLTTSLRKYYDMIQAWGDWKLFQELLKALQEVAKKHNVDLASVAARWVLDQPAMGAVIVGTRFGTTSHLESTLKTFEVHLDDGDRKKINDVVGRGRHREMFEQIGDCGDEYR